MKSLLLVVMAVTSAHLLELEKEWNAAIVRKDFAALDRILADDFVYIDAIGGVNPKKAMLEGLRNSKAAIEPFVTEDVSVRIYGDTAVLTGRFTQKVSLAGQTFEGQFRYTDVYVKNGERWQAVAAQASRIPDPQVRGAIEAADRQIEEAIARGDAAALAALYTQDGMAMPPNGESVSGRAKLEEYWRETMKSVNRMKLSIQDFYTLGDTAAEVGTYVAYGAENNELESGKYIVIWRKENLRWKLHRDSWSSNR